MAFENCGIDLRQQICFERTLMTPTQLAFHQRSAKSLAYFIEKFGFDYAMDQLLQSRGITNEIVRHALNPTIDMDLAELLRDKLGIDFNAQYHYNSETGNALIFVDKSDYLKPDFKFSFKL